ncbi:hypothetical protein PENFLA_c017G06525 [Penicillium flavigenum]|uniref:Uncharacterized protein n=1 Tax=Penicillium flavigenum TaxID=254877 RepID=A0A1V6T1B6_9EURO|nr:hypothetical protein PENFLA_c017G06525 [Penicillium flavigenum]
MPGDKDAAAEWCTHCNAGGHTLQQCEYFAHYTRGIAIAMHAIAQNSNSYWRNRAVTQDVGSFMRFDPLMYLTQNLETSANEVYLNNSKSIASKSPVLPSTNTTNTGK